ncbi:MAG: flagellar biosynthetic protein FliO [Candidatus Eisenbacteria bacterium]
MKKNRMLLVLFPVLCGAALLFSWGPLHGDGPAGTVGDGAPALAGGGPDVGGLAAKVVLSLVLIVVLILGASYAVRFFDGRGPAGPRAGKVRVLDRCFLAPKRALYTVRMGDRVVVVGVTDQTITPVLEFSEEEGEKLYPEPPPPAMEESATFAGVLKGLTARIGRTRG